MIWTDQIFEDFKKGRLEVFYKYIYPDILVYATNLLRGEGAFRAEDCVQDAIEASYRRRMEFTSSTQWRAFIIACIRNKAISITRHNEARSNYISALELDFEFSSDLLNDFIEVETRTRLYNAILTLPPELQQIFILNFEEGLKNAEIAEKLGVAEITIKKRKAKLIHRLRDILGPESYYIYYYLLFQEYQLLSSDNLADIFP